MRFLAAALLLAFAAQADANLIVGPQSSGGGGTPTADGTPANASAGATATIALTLTCPTSGDLIYVAGQGGTGLGGGTVLTVSDTAGLTWHLRAQELDVGGARITSTAYAVAPGAITSDTITLGSVSNAISFSGAEAICVKGYNAGAPFDPNGSIPALAQANTAAPATSGVSTTFSTPLVIATVTAQGAGPPSADTGFTLVWNAGATGPVGALEYEAAGSALSGATVNFPVTGTSAWGMTVDAIQ